MFGRKFISRQIRKRTLKKIVENSKTEMRERQKHVTFRNSQNHTNDFAAKPIFGKESSCHAKTLHFAHTYKRPPIAHPLTSWHYTPPSHPTTPFLLIPAPTFCTLHPTITPSIPSARNFCSIVFPKISSHSPWQGSHLVGVPSVSSQPWRFTNNSLSLPPAYSFSVCLSSWVCVVCTCFLLYLSVYPCFARCLFSVWFHTHFTFSNFKIYIYMTVVVHITLVICLYLFRWHL